jgi:hypothetical protein
MTTSVAALATNMVADRIGWGQQSPADVSTISRCSTQYGMSSLPWVSTDWFTSTSYAYRSKTELLTPKPSTTSVSATSTYTEYETAPNNLTKTVYTDTYTWTDYRTQSDTISVTSTITESVLQTVTVPTQAGFTPVAANYPEATQHVDEYADQDKWTVEDSYWQDEGEQQPVPLLYARDSGPASKVECLVTLINYYFMGTTSTRSYVTPPTYTRTSYVATVTTTTTVRTKISPTETPYTYSMASGLAITSWFTETRTHVDTVSFQLPS